MSYKDLYNYVAGLNEYPVVLETRVVPKIKELSGQDEVYFVPVDQLDISISLGHIKQYRQATGVYSDSQWITEIRYATNPAVTFCWRRFVCCKELMHIFDSPNERATDQAKLELLLSELETPPPWDKASDMYKSETRTQWMALGVLCPLPLREQFRAKLEAEDLNKYQVALALRIPETTVDSLMSPYFEGFITSLLNGE